MCSPKHNFWVSMRTRADSSFSDEITLPICNWLFYLEGGTCISRAAILRVAMSSIQQEHCLGVYIVYMSLD